MKLSKERIDWIQKHVTYLPDKEFDYLAAIVRRWVAGGLFPSNKLTSEILSLMGEGKQLAFYKIGRFRYEGQIYKYAFLPTIIGYEYIMHEEAPKKIDVPTLSTSDEEEVEEEIPISDEEEYYNELSADTEERLSDYDEDYIGDMRYNTYMSKVLGMPGVKPNKKQMILKEIADDLVIDNRMDSEQFIKTNKLQSKLGFTIGLRPTEEEIWCSKVFEYRRKRRF